MIIKMNSNKDSMLKDNQDNIQAKESTLRQTRCTTIWTYMSKWVGELYNKKSHYDETSKRINQYTHHVNISDKYNSQA